MRNKRALSVADVQAYNPKLIEFEGEWLEAIGKPELTGSWIIYGPSANGKTRFALQLAKNLATFKRTAYNSIEEGLSATIKRAIIETGMNDVARRFILLDKEPIIELAERLRKKKSPDVIIIDSLQYTGLKYSEYTALKDEFRNKLFIFISHAEGKQPRGNVAKSIKFDANVKIWVQGYTAFCESRYGGGKPFTIWEKRG